MFDVVIQGPVNKHLLSVIDTYRKPYVGNIIYSGWVDDPAINLPSDILQVKSTKPLFPGCGNVNLQAQTTKAGISLVTSELVLKTRSDLCINGSDLDRFYDYYLKHTKILTTCISKQYAFYTLDFIYFGKTADIKLLFNCQLDMAANYYPNVNRGIPEVHLTANYIANFDARVKELCNNPKHHLWYQAPGHAAALKLGLEVIEDYFKPLPCIDLMWCKHYSSYKSLAEVLRPRTSDYFSQSW